MNEVIKAKIEVHANEASRLLNNPLVREYQHHMNQIVALQQQLPPAEEAKSSEPATETEQPALTKVPRTRRKK
ncbi:MAG TPA: hypothetical protein VNQ76_09260 [Planctomicrobium sp.]|nr:hypothetical protein [Planctomicrobium sp.]